jgi:hypothetical protein
LKPQKHLVWEDGVNHCPNEKYQCSMHVFFVLGARVCSVYGPSEAEPWFKLRNGRKQYATVEEAKMRAIKKWIEQTNTEILKMQRMVEVVKDSSCYEKPRSIEAPSIVNSR